MRLMNETTCVDGGVAEPTVGEIFDPLTGELVSTDDVDGMIDFYERVMLLEKELRAAKVQLQRAFAAHSKGVARTRRVEGERRKVRIELPGPGWDQPRLKEAWGAYPRFRVPYLRVDAVGVNLREYKKLIETTGPGDLMAFKSLVSAARKPSTGNPRVAIER